MPEDFRHREILDKGRPVHGKYEDFSARHPKMDVARRAKQFMAFDALKGFSDRIAETERAEED